MELEILDTKAMYIDGNYELVTELSVENTANRGVIDIDIISNPRLCYTGSNVDYIVFTFNDVKYFIEYQPIFLQNVNVIDNIAQSEFKFIGNGLLVPISSGSDSVKLAPNHLYKLRDYMYCLFINNNNILTTTKCYKYGEPDKLESMLSSACGLESNRYWFIESIEDVYLNSFEILSELPKEISLDQKDLDDIISYIDRNNKFSS